MQRVTTSWFKNLNHLLFTPRSHDPDDRRREFIVNVLVCGLAIVSGIALIYSIFALFAGGLVNGDTSVIVTVISFGIICGLWWLSRHGHHRAVSYVILTLIGLLALELLLSWSFELPMAELALGLLIVTAGVLLPARPALALTGVAVVGLLALSVAQIEHLIHPHTSWLAQPLILGDAIGYAIVFCAIGLVSWLANREVDRSLKRARASESALAEERDTLEVKVKERTHELEQTQLAHAFEVQRFAEFGRMSAGLVHDVSNPLTALSLNLEQLHDAPQSNLLGEARQNLNQLARYLETVRKQLQAESTSVTFSVNSELEQVVTMLEHKARQANVRISVNTKEQYKLEGDPVKFSQAVANLVANAIEAYPETAKGKARLVDINVEKKPGKLGIAVCDEGPGIASKDLTNIFKPFYSTKARTGRGMGIGLAMVKEYIEKDFSGSITAKSSKGSGTRFTITIPVVGRDSNAKG